MINVELVGRSGLPLARMSELAARFEADIRADDAVEAVLSRVGYDPMFSSPSEAKVNRAVLSVKFKPGKIMKKQVRR